MSTLLITFRSLRIILGGQRDATPFVDKSSDTDPSEDALVGYIEPWNEPDKTNLWYDSGSWPNNPALIGFTPDEYVAFARSCFDGANNMVRGDTPTDPNSYDLGMSHYANLRYVAAAVSDIDDASLQYMVDVNAGFPDFDVINFHYYCDTDWEKVVFENNAHGISPEDDHYGVKNSSGIVVDMTFKERMIQIRDMFPGRELWMSEFGWDTNESSPQRVPTIAANPNGINEVADQQEVQGQWLIRAYLEIAAAGWDRAMQFCVRDSDPNGNLFDASGFLRDKLAGYAPKKSYYYVSTMKAALTGATFTEEHSADPFSNNAADPRVLRFSRGGGSVMNGETVYAVWLPSSNNELLEDFVLRFEDANASSATLTSMIPGDLDGVRSELQVEYDSEGAFVRIDVTERPIFVTLGIAVTDNLADCPVFTAEGVACDAVQIQVTLPAGVQPTNYRVYYLEKPDSEENGIIPVFDIANPEWRLFSASVHGKNERFTVSGLNLREDNYYFYIETLFEQNGQQQVAFCPVIFGATLGCAAHIPSDNFTIVSPSTSISAAEGRIIQYNDISFCYPQQFPIDITGMQYGNFNGNIVGIAGDVVIDLGDEYIIESVSIYDIQNEGRLNILYSSDMSGVFNNNLTDEVTILFFDYWWDVPTLSQTNAVRQILIHKTDLEANYGRIVLHGYRNDAGNYPEADCCHENDPSYIVIGDGDATGIQSKSISLGSAVFPNAVISDQRFIVHGALILDQNYSFENCDFLMMPGSKIDNRENLLSLTNSRFEGCEHLWDGIHLRGGAEVHSFGSRYRNALTTFQISGSQNRIPSLQFVNSLFEANYLGIETSVPKSWVSTLDMRSRFLYSTTFDGTESDLKPLWTNFQSKLPLYWNDRARAGVFSRFLPNLKVGSDNLAPTEFKNLQQGIIASNSDVEVNNSRFESITSDNLYDGSGQILFGQLGIGIGALGGQLTANGRLSFGNPITISKTRWPIIVNRSQLPRIQDFTIRGGEAGILAYSIVGPETDISGNDINGEGTAILCFSSTSQVAIHDNEIWTTGFGDGISISEYLRNPSTSLFEVTNNNIRLENTLQNNAAIRASSTNNASISTDNYDPMTKKPQLLLHHYQSVPAFGVQAAASNGIQIHGNYINGASGGTNFGDDYLTNVNAISRTGIQISNSSGWDISCNSLNETRDGIVFNGGNTLSSERLSQNIFKDHAAGLVLLNGANIGAQTHRWNAWDAHNQNAFANGKKARHWSVEFSDWDLSLFTVKEAGTNGSLYDPQGEVFPIAAAGKWFKTDPDPANIPPLPCAPELSYYECETPESCYSAWLWYSLNPNYGYYYHWIKSLYERPASEDPYPLVQWETARAVYAAIKQVYPNGASDEYLDAFVENNIGTAIGQLYALDQAMLASEVFSLEAIQDLVQQNTAILAENEFVQLEKTVNAIYLQTITSDSVHLLDSFKEDLFDIATLCPAEFGEAVIRARVLYTYIDPNSGAKWGDCGALEVEVKGRSLSDVSESDILSIQPNPVTNKQVQFYTSQLDAMYQIYNTNGQLLQEGASVEGVNSIAVHTLESGVYILTIINDTTRQSAKFVIQH